MDPVGEMVAFVPALDLDAAAGFYGGVLGLQIVERSDFALVLRSGTACLRVTLVESLTPQPFTVLGWDVDDLDSTVHRLADAGVVPNRYDGMAQDESGVWTAPSGSRILWFTDPAGNVLSVAQHPA